MNLDSKLMVKPLSANKMFGGRGNRTFKSKDYVAYQTAIQAELQDVAWPFGAEQVSVIIDAGLSNRGADIDNIVKPLLDTYQLVFAEFNDNKVYYVELHKHIVSKGDEFIRVRVGRFADGLRNGEDTSEGS